MQYPKGEEACIGKELRESIKKQPKRSSDKELFVCSPFLFSQFTIIRRNYIFWSHNPHVYLFLFIVTLDTAHNNCACFSKKYVEISHTD